MEIKSVSFVKSSAHPRECPPMDRPEYAFIGRSNVGKSSLINMIVGRLKMAKISSTPGKTQLINHFMMNEPDKKTKEDASWYLTDLPGFGYAKTSKKDRVKWERTSKQFLEGRRNLMCVMMLVDSKRPTSNNRFSPIDYLFIESRNDLISNPNLKPSR